MAYEVVMMISILLPWSVPYNLQWLTYMQSLSGAPASLQTVSPKRT